MAIHTTTLEQFDIEEAAKMWAEKKHRGKAATEAKIHVQSVTTAGQVPAVTIDVKLKDKPKEAK